MGFAIDINAPCTSPLPDLSPALPVRFHSSVSKNPVDRLFCQSPEFSAGNTHACAMACLRSIHRLAVGVKLSRLVCFVVLPFEPQPVPAVVMEQRANHWEFGITLIGGVFFSRV